MASNPVITSTPISDTDKLKQMLKTVTDAALFIEQILAGVGIGGANASEAESLTLAFGNLAAIAIQAAHDVAGKQITPDSVLELLPVNTPLIAPVPAVSPAKA
ncbi:MAG: hypothetical protein WA738_03220 [Candidatus Angelobacter sp.]